METNGITGRDAFARHVRPLLMERLRAIGLDVEYERGIGDTLYFRDEGGEEVAVTDFVAGYGAGLFGHNHPELVARLEETVRARRPFHAQASVRGRAGELAARLSALVGRATDREYVVTFGSTGADAVEAALKHAELERIRRGEALLERLAERGHQLRMQLRTQAVTLPDELLDDAEQLLGVPSARTLDDVLAGVQRAALAAVECEPLFLAVEGAFHGKTTGSLRLTAGREYRTPWRHLGPKTAFLPRGDDPVAAARVLAEAVARQQRTYFEVEPDPDGVLRLVERSVVHVGACFVEPIQGEGGIREVAPAYMQMLRAAADQHGFPLVIDEIQSGLGRAGEVLASAASGVRGDYYVFSKALGGGLAKISALFVDRERYVDDFGYLHTSTFADDDLTSSVALGVVDLLERDEGALLVQVREKGAYFMRRLRELQARYPEQLRAVRGRGLMIGLELAPPLESPSPLLRVIAEQRLLAFVVSGHLLHEHRIRVAPTLTSHGTIRLQPSAYVSREALDECVAAIEHVLRLLRDADIHGLVRFVTRLGAGPADATRDAAGVDAPSNGAPADAERGAMVAPGVSEAELQALADDGELTFAPVADGEVTQVVGFLSHFTGPEDLRDWEPGLARLTADECERFFERAGGMLEPFEVMRFGLRSATGTAVRGVVIAIPFTPGQISAGLRSGDIAWAQAMVRAGVDAARRRGASMIGFGGYTSIVTNSCRDISASDVGLTSGNSLTSAAALEALFLAADRIGVKRRRLGVLGAAGNIGMVLAEAVADRVDEIVLIGRDHPRALRVLQASAKSLAERAGVPVEVATSPDALRDCTLVISATSAPHPVILPEHVGTHPVVIADVAVPGDVHPDVVTERPNAVVLRGGIVTAPGRQAIRIPGMRLGAGEVYGCLAETTILGLAGVRDHFSYGALTVANVRRIAEIARAHGFTITESATVSAMAAMRGAR